MSPMNAASTNTTKRVPIPEFPQDEPCFSTMLSSKFIDTVTREDFTRAWLSTQTSRGALTVPPPNATHSWKSNATSTTMAEISLSEKPSISDNENPTGPPSTGLESDFIDIGSIFTTSLDTQRPTNEKNTQPPPKL